MITKEMKAYCTSLNCSGLNFKRLGVIKDVAPKTVNCPNCKAALYWWSGTSASKKTKTKKQKESEAY